LQRFSHSQICTMHICWLARFIAAFLVISSFVFIKPINYN